MSIVISNLPYGDRRPDLFIDTMVKSAAVLNRFRLVDGVKAKVNVPIFDATLSFGSDLCVFDGASAATIGEKEMTVTTYKWSFLNCKNALETSYRGLLLKKGQNNPETTEMAADAAVLDYDTNGALTSANILDKLEGAYETMSDVMLAAVYGDADRDFKPAIFLGTAAMQHYQIAIAGLYTTTPQGVVEGGVPNYYGMEVIHFPSMPANEFMIAAPQNIVMLTDEYNDVRAIDMKYEAELSSDKIWGQFKLGFSYLKGEEIVYAKDFA